MNEEPRSQGLGEVGAEAGRARRKRLMKWLPWSLLGLLLVYAGTGLYHLKLKPLPAGLSLRGDPVEIRGDDVEFLYDVTREEEGKCVSQQMIFDRVFGLVRGAEDFLLLDMFLFNDYLAKETTVHRKLADDLTNALIEKKRNRPSIRVVFITDPVNQAYGGPVPKHIKALRDAGIEVVFTDLRKLRDSNPVYSALWRMCFQWFGSSADGAFPHPFSSEAGGVAARSWLELMNFKANHRKLLVADAPGEGGAREMVSLVASANPHDGSSAHHNVALVVRNGVWQDLVRSEQAVLSFSGTKVDLASWLPKYAETNRSRNPVEEDGVVARVVTEGKIRDALLEILDGTEQGDSVDVGMFYLSDRRIIRALSKAAQRGVGVRLLLDANRDAFGYEKSGIPNRPVAAELARSGKVAIRWCNTHGEQFHTKMVLVKSKGEITMLTGSANLTRRNIGGFNLETNVMVRGDEQNAALRTAAEYFELMWTSESLSVPYEVYAENSRWKRLQYRFQEFSGLCTF